MRVLILYRSLSYMGRRFDVWIEETLPEYKVPPFLARELANLQDRFSGEVDVTVKVRAS